MPGQPQFGRPIALLPASPDPKVVGSGADPTTGVAVAVPDSASSFSVYVTGTAGGAFWMRTQLDNSLSQAPAANNCHTYPVATLVGPFSLDSEWDKFVVIAKATGATITAYAINFYRN